MSQRGGRVFCAAVFERLGKRCSRLANIGESYCPQCKSARKKRDEKLDEDEKRREQERSNRVQQDLFVEFYNKFIGYLNKELDGSFSLTFDSSPAMLTRPCRKS